MERRVDHFYPWMLHIDSSYNTNEPQHVLRFLETQVSTEVFGTLWYVLSPQGLIQTFGKWITPVCMKFEGQLKENGKNFEDVCLDLSWTCADENKIALGGEF